MLTGAAQAADITLLNVSYDPTRELYADINKAFARRYKAETGKTIDIKQSHGGSGRQARSVIDGLQADVVTLALAYDIDEIADRGLIAADWQKRLPQNASPYTSTIVFLVRKGNPKGIKDWDDLAKPECEGDHAQPQDVRRCALELSRCLGLCAEEIRRRRQGAQFRQSIFKNVPVLDTGARGSTVTFVERNVGDVLIAWENEAFLSINEFGKDKFEIVVPSLSILAEPPVAVVDKVVDKKGTRAPAEAYLKFIYTPEGQEIAAKHFYRPRDRGRGEEIRTQLPEGRAFHHRRRVWRLAEGADRRTSRMAVYSTRSTRSDRGV